MARAGRRMPRWTKEQLARLVERHPSHSNLEIASEIGRTVSSVASKANELGLRKDKERLQEMGRDNVSQRYK